MKKIFFTLLAITGLLASVKAQDGSDGARDERMQWWREARFGMFIHWGVYAVPAGVYKGQRIGRIGEWIMNRGKIPVAEYQQFAGQFNPVNYDADAWVKLAKEAGMKYIVITAKHHDGFALFNSSASKWDMTDATPYKKDLLKPLAEACRKNGIKLGFYYSHAQDWCHPGGAAIRRVATEGWANPDSAAIDAYTAAHEGHWDPVQFSKPMSQYIDEVAVPQVKELLTNYGDVAILWWDTPTGMTDEFAEKLQAPLKLQPHIITNDRLKRPNFPGDYKTPEQRIPNLSELDGRDWETCMTMNDTWGFKSYDSNWKSTQTLVRNLLDIASKGGNYLLNVGPKADGTLPQESIQRLKEVGEWMKANGEAVYNTKASPLAPVAWGRITRKEVPAGTVLYLSVFDWPANGTLVVRGVKNAVIRAKLLATGKALKTSAVADGISIAVPATSLNNIATVIKLELKGNVPAAQRVLVFSKTAGYHHQSIPDGVKAVQELGLRNNFIVDTTTNAARFTEEVLKKYAAVVFVSPSGDVFDTAQQADFERYIQAGGGYMGIHAATTVEYNWPWYGKLVGGFFDGHPKPQEAVVSITDATNDATKHLPLKWKRNDEWYNFRNMSNDLKILMTVDETTYTGGKHGAFHPLAWYQDFDGGRAFYTALGHFGEAYSDPLLLQHILAGIRYAMGNNVQLDYSKAKTQRITK